MPKYSGRPLSELLRTSRHELSMTQREFGEALGASERTAQRWERGRSYPYSALDELAGLVLPVNRDLAVEIARHAGGTLESLGLERKPVPAAPAAPLSPASRATERDLADVVLCAVADASDLPPRALRPLLHVAFARAHALGLTVEQLEDAFKPHDDTKTRVAIGAPGTLRLRAEMPEPYAATAEVEPVPGARRRARVR